MRALYRALQPVQDGAELLVTDVATARLKPGALRGGDVAAHRLYVERELRSDALLLRPAHPEQKDSFDLNHRDLAVRHRGRLDGRSVTRRQRGNAREKTRFRQGGMLVRSSARQGECSGEIWAPRVPSS